MDLHANGRQFCLVRGKVRKCMGWDIKGPVQSHFANRDKRSGVYVVNHKVFMDCLEGHALCGIATKPRTLLDWEMANVFKKAKQYFLSR